MAPVVIIQCEKPLNVDNQPPIPEVVVTPAKGLTTTLFSFDGSPTKPGNIHDEMYFRWDWNGDGLWDTKYSSVPTFTHRFYTAGLHRPILEVLNSSGISDTSQILLIVNQGYSAPKAAFKIDPPLGNTLTDFVFDGSTTKDDEDSLNQLLFRWDWDGNGIWETAFTSDYLAAHRYIEVGSYQPAMEVKDPSGLISRFQTSLEVNKTNSRLSVSFSWNPQNPLQLDSVTLDASQTKDLDHPERKLD